MELQQAPTEAGSLNGMYAVRSAEMARGLPGSGEP